MFRLCWLALGFAGLFCSAVAQSFGRPRGRDEPRGSPPLACDVMGEPFYSEAELPAVHQLDLRLPQADFDALVRGGADPDDPTSLAPGFSARTRLLGAEKVGALVFNDATYEGVAVQGFPRETHGGDYERRDMRWKKPSLRLTFQKADPFHAKHGVPFGFPASNHCNNMRRLVLRGEWNDHPLSAVPGGRQSGGGLMIRNKLQQDLIKKIGGATPREDFAELHVNGRYFGLYGLEEVRDDAEDALPRRLRRGWEGDISLLRRRPLGRSSWSAWAGTQKPRASTPQGRPPTRRHGGRRAARTRTSTPRAGSG
jgi:hypothetical protein